MLTTIGFVCISLLRFFELLDLKFERAHSVSIKSLCLVPGRTAAVNPDSKPRNRLPSFSFLSSICAARECCSYEVQATGNRFIMLETFKPTSIFPI